jgi:hypothetical protein
MREPGENWVGESVDNIKIEISEDAENPWIVPSKGMLRVTYVSFPKPPTDDNAIEIFALNDLLEKISRSKVGPAVSSKDRLDVVFSVASETFFTSSNIARILEEFDERVDRVNLILRMFDRCTDFENKKDFINCLSDEERRLVAKTLGQLYSFTPGYPAGHYTLDLGNRYDRLLAIKLQEQANLQNDQANALGLLDSGQLGNGERCWRNVVVDGADVKCVACACCSSERFDNLVFRYDGRFRIPSRGKLTMDISSIASSFAQGGNTNSSAVFNRTESEEFLTALKEIIDSGVSQNQPDRAYVTAIDTLRSRLLSGRMLSCKMVMLCPETSIFCVEFFVLSTFLQAMSLAALFPEVPSRDFAAVDSTSTSTDAASIMSGSTSAATSRPSTAAANRPFSAKDDVQISTAGVFKKILPQSFLVSAADCLHCCHAHLTDPENFWKSINDACVPTLLRNASR